MIGMPGPAPQNSPTDRMGQRWDQTMGPNQLPSGQKVHLRPADDPQVSCGSCEFFTAPDQCSQISDKVDASQLCDLYQEKTEGPDLGQNPQGAFP